MSQAPERQCPGCGTPIDPYRAFCTPKCRAHFHNRMSKRGRVAMPLALAWRAGRGQRVVSKAAFKELCQYLDKCNAEDLAAGRPLMERHIERRGDWNGGADWRDR